MTDDTLHNDAVQGHILSSHFGLLTAVLKHQGVASAVRQAQAAGVPWITIITTILQLIGPLFSGGTINWQTIIAAILALFNPHKP